ncbi:hypothetical protein HanRHA438_Chr10g0472021 [Helianthus annuus]|nr:hypothetical protein HanRHA438_Chr10g0472021 [Helianthus annuus]
MVCYLNVMFEFLSMEGKKMKLQCKIGGFPYGVQNQISESVSEIQISSESDIQISNFLFNFYFFIIFHIRNRIVSDIRI